MRAVLPPLVALAGFVLYFVVTTRLGIYRRYPWEFVALIAAGAGWGVVRFLRGPAAGTAVSAALAVGVLGFASWYLFSYSMYGAREDRPAVGERFPDFTLPASEGPPFALAAARGRRLLLVFYRGAW